MTPTEAVLPPTAVARRPQVAGAGPRSDTRRVAAQWELREAGPVDAERTVLLLPGGMCGAGSYAEVMAESALASMRLVAATLPGNAGAPPPDDYSIENYARLTRELANEV